MAQYTFSYLQHEYDRIPYILKKNLDQILADSAADEETKKLVSAVCAAVEEAVADLAHYAKDQLLIR